MTLSWYEIQERQAEMDAMEAYVDYCIDAQTDGYNMDAIKHPLDVGYLESYVYGLNDRIRELTAEQRPRPWLNQQTSPKAKDDDDDVDLGF